MTIIKLNKKYIQPFKEYCQTFRYVHDESYLYEEDMDEFEPLTGKHPTLLLLDEKDMIIGVLSLMQDDYFLAGHKSRIRIFHCSTNNPNHYRQLFEALPKLHKEVKIVEAFLPVKAKNSIDTFKALGFTYFRTAYVMVRKDKETVTAVFPTDYELKPFVVGQDEINYAHIRNTAFKTLKGSEAPITIDIVKKLTTADHLLKDGVQILWNGDQAVGIVRMEEDEDANGKYSFVAPIALLPEHQGKGLGTQLLKAGIAIGQNNGFNNCMLCVNAENEQALGLYKKVGFEIDEAIGCYHFEL